MRAIDADACESYFYEHLDDNGMAAAMNAINDMPTIEPQRKKGKWIYLDKDKRFFHPHIVKCSVCNNTLDMYGVNAGRGDANYCPNCGAEMREDGEANEAD